MMSSAALCRIFRMLGVFLMIGCFAVLLVTQRWTTDDGLQPQSAVSLGVLLTHRPPAANSGPALSGPHRPSAGYADEGDRFAIRTGDPGRLDLPVKEILLADLVTPDVHFLWCGTGWFEFKNYLAVMSVRRAIQPDKIYIHFENQPTYDRVFYHQVSDRWKFSRPQTMFS